MGVNDGTEQSQAGRAARITSAISACSAVNQEKGIHLAWRQRQDPVAESSEQLQDAKPQAGFSCPPPVMNGWPLMAIDRLRLGVCQLH